MVGWGWEGHLTYSRKDMNYSQLLISKLYREVVNRMRSLKFKEKKKKPRMLYPEKLSLRMKKKQKFYQKKKNC